MRTSEDLRGKRHSIMIPAVAPLELGLARRDVPDDLYGSRPRMLHERPILDLD